MMRAIDRRLQRALRPARIIIVLLVVSMIVSLATLGWVVQQQVTHPLTNQIVDNQITACEATNANRIQQTQVWQQFYALQAQEAKESSALLADLITALAAGDPARIRQIDTILAASNKINTADQSRFLANVAKVNAPVDCQKRYNVSTGG